MNRQEHYAALEKLSRIYDEFRGFMSTTAYSDYTLSNAVADAIARIETGLPERNLKGQIDLLDDLIQTLVDLLTSIPIEKYNLEEALAQVQEQYITELAEQEAAALFNLEAFTDELGF